MTREERLRRKREWWNKWYPKHRELRLDRLKEQNWRVKVEVLTYYGDGKCACVRCSFDDIRGLTLDHINGRGETERRKYVIKRGTNFYHWLRKLGYPPGYQTLCANCQSIKRVENREWGGMPCNMS